MSLNIFFFVKNYSHTVSDFIYEHRNFSVKIKKIEKKIIDIQCQFITKNGTSGAESNNVFRCASRD